MLHVSRLVLQRETNNGDLQNAPTVDIVAARRLVAVRMKTKSPRNGARYSQTHSSPARRQPVGSEQNNVQFVRWLVLVILGLITLALAPTTVVYRLSWREEIRRAPHDVLALGYRGMVIPLGYGALSLLALGATMSFYTLTCPKRWQGKSVPRSLGTDPPA
ncbi:MULTISPECIES: hypothetical protein [unclassified Deinococcus]|uniref:hypothetical protein n=1 Tax=unclassified Deinococcus TaxID=2623546 RepID=UPI000993493B|nr:MULTISPECIES: hypothetical protein [unclassified Deinococcus]MBX8465812.1 hypothetical protein [Deinococcus sp. RIT780]NTX99124.1 hypothetical protein [Deinococcus sp. JMULE3]OOV12268.1 hypothetical protein BXU09_18415 [Deinococcus sp. LM3]